MGPFATNVIYGVEDPVSFAERMKEICRIKIHARYKLQQQTETQTTKRTCTERSRETDRDTELYIAKAQITTATYRQAIETKSIGVKDAKGTYRRDRDNKKKHK